MHDSMYNGEYLSIDRVIKGYKWLNCVIARNIFLAQNFGGVKMRTWDSINNVHIETPKEMIEFFKEIDEVCRKHDLSISHEDYQGAFIIEKYSKHNIEWLKDAHKDY
jgi:hypothetical protein